MTTHERTGNGRTSDRSPQGASQRDGSSSGGYGDLVRAVPGLTRIAVVAGLRTAEWSIGTSWRAGARVLRAAVAGESPAELFQDASSELREYARRVLELTGSDNGAQAVAPEPEEPEAETTAVQTPHPENTPSRLRERGADLLRRSAEVGFDEDAHPAFSRILDELAPDEGRILRLLAVEGPQASVDVRTSRLKGTSELVAPGLNMIDAAAGCRNAERVQIYLNNLNRLGLVWFSHEPLDDVNRYQLLEAQPEVAEAMEEAGRGARTVRRSIRLTPFGEDFCDTCLPLHTAELDELPGAGRDETGESAREGDSRRS